MSSKHLHGHGSSRDRDYDRRPNYGRDGRDKRDDRGTQHHRSQRETDGDRMRGDQERGARSKSSQHGRSRSAHASQSPHRDRAGGYHSGTTPSKSKGNTPGPKGNSVLAELLRTAKAKQQEQGAGGAGSVPGSGSGSDGELPEAGEILPPPPSQSGPQGAAGAGIGGGGGTGGSAGGTKRRYHSPIVWNLDGPGGGGAGRTGGGGGGGGGGDGRPPPAKRHAPTSAVDRAAEELAAFRRQQAEAAAALGYDPDGPPAMKGSPSASESEEGDAGGRWRGSVSEERGDLEARGREGDKPDRDRERDRDRDGDRDRRRDRREEADRDRQPHRGRSEDLEEEVDLDEDMGGRPRGGSRWLDEEAAAEPNVRSGGGGSGPGADEQQDEQERGRGRPSPSPRRAASAGGEAVSGRDGGGRGSSPSRTPEEAADGRGGGGAGAAGRAGGGGDEGGVGSGDGDEPLISQQIASLAECRSVDEYERLNRVSEGTYGVVFRARCKKTGRICALKKIKMEKERDGFPVTSIREINILLNLHHPNIVNVSEVVMGSRLDQIYMVMEFMDHDLKSLMNDKSQMTRPFSVAEVKCLMLQLLGGLEYLHENWVIHRDLKTSNILYNNRGELKICDFGLARQFGSPLRAYTQPVVTLWYRPPELLLGEPLYSTAVDMWSIGCIMAELLTGKPLFDGQGEIEQLDKICTVLGTPNEEVWPGLKKLPNWGKIVLRPQPSQLRQRFTSSFGSGATLTEAGFDLLSRLLAYDPQQRITAAEALDHRWFSESPYPQRRELMPTFRSNKDGSGPVRQAAVGGAPGSPPLHFMAAALKAR